MLCFVENGIHLINHSHLVATERVKEMKAFHSLSFSSISKTKQRGGVFIPHLFQKEVGRRLKDKSETADFRTIWWLKRWLICSWRIRWMDAMESWQKHDHDKGRWIHLWPFHSSNNLALSDRCYHNKSTKDSRIISAASNHSSQDGKNNFCWKQNWVYLNIVFFPTNSFMLLH